MSRAIQRCGRHATVLLAVAFAAPAIGAGAAQASPARYIYEQCDSVLPGGGSAGVTFPAISNTPYVASNSCAQPGGALTISQVGTSFGSYMFWNVPNGAPAGSHTESITLSATVCTQGDPAVLAYAFQQPWLDNCREETRTFRNESSLALGFRIWLECNSRTSSCPPGPSIAAHYFATTMADPVAPSVTSLAGSLLSGPVARGHQTLSGVGHDVGGGLSKLSVLVNGLAAGQPKASRCALARANNPSIVGTVAATPSPCPESESASWTLDTSALPFHDGANSVQVCASDFATIDDPNTTCSAPQSVNVDNSCAESQVVGGETLSAQFSQSSSDSITVGYGRKAEIAGALTTDAGRPVAGATLCVQTQTLGVKASPVSAGTVKTDAEGRYSYTVPAGPNRKVQIGYRHDSIQIARQLRYYAHTKPSLRSSARHLRNGEWIHFSGQLPGPHRRGRVVVLQANVVGSKRWITFRKATSAYKGIFRAAYHFSATTRATIYRFRAVVPNQTGYPWVEGASKPVKIKVTG